MIRTYAIPGAMHRAWYHSITEYVRTAIFFIFLILSIRIIAVYTTYLPANLKVIGIVGLTGFALAAWRTPFWTLNVFLATIPLISGIQLLAGTSQAFSIINSAPIFSFLFAVIYCVWYFKVGAYKPNTLATGTFGNFADLLSGIVVISLVFSLVAYPQELFLNIIISAPEQGQEDPGWATQASYIILQGLFYFRIMEKELKKRNEWVGLWFVISVHTGSIIFFSAIQCINNLPQKAFAPFGVFSPFHDIHSSGSYLLFVFFIFLSLSVIRHRFRIITILLSLYFGVFIIQLGSKMTWIALITTTILFCLKKLKAKHNLLLLVLVLTGFIFINLWSDKLFNSERIFFSRLENTFVASNYIEKTIDHSRLALWQRAFQIMNAYPFTGSGVGSYFRVSPYFNNSNSDSWNGYYENAHNYYLQMGADLGIPALLLFFSIIFVTVVSCSKCSSRNLTPSWQCLKEGAFFGFIAYLLTMLTGHPLILSSHQFLFWFMIALLCFNVKNEERSAPKTSFRPALQFFVILLLILCIFIGHAYTLTIRRSPIIYENGFYPPEDEWENKFRWSMKEAWLKMQPTGKRLNFDVYVSPFSFSPAILNNENLLVNGNFDSQTHGWMSDEDCIIISTHDGKIGNGVSMQARTGVQKWMRQESLQLAKGKYYQFSLWFRDGSRKGRKIRASMYDGRNEIWATYENSTFLTTTGVWQRLTHTFQCPRSSDNWKFYIYWQDEAKEGSVFFDEAHLHELTFDHKKPLNVIIRIKDVMIDEQIFTHTGTYTLSYEIPTNAHTPIEIFLSVERGFNPYALSLSMDTSQNRVQGIAVGPMIFIE